MKASSVTDSPAGDTPLRAVAYVRRSHKDQENSLEVQISQIKGYFAWKGSDFDPVFDLHVETESAARVPFFERPMAKVMLEYMRRNRLHTIVFTKLDRAFRNTIDCLTTLRAFEKEGITCHFLDISVDMSTPIGRMVITLLAAIAEFEVERRAERQGDTLDFLRERNRVLGGIPYGWRRDDDDNGLLVPEVTEQRVLECVGEAYANGHRAKSIATMLNTAGVPSKKGGEWSKSTVRGILANARLADGSAVVAGAEFRNPKSPKSEEGNPKPTEF